VTQKAFLVYCNIATYRISYEPSRKICVFLRADTMGDREPDNSKRNFGLLDQMQRTIIGVTRDGGTVYKNHAALKTSSTTSKSTSQSQLDSGLRVVSIQDAIGSRIASLRAPSGRLDRFYHGLTVPMRNAPWMEDNRLTVEPLCAGNSQYLTDRGRHTTMNRAQSLGAFPDMSVPQVADRFNKQTNSNFNKTKYRERCREVEARAKRRNNVSDELDFRRVAHKSAFLRDYYDRVNGKYCHVV